MVIGWLVWCFFNGLVVLGTLDVHHQLKDVRSIKAGCN